MNKKQSAPAANNSKEPRNRLDNLSHEGLWEDVSDEEAISSSGGRFQVGVLNWNNNNTWGGPPILPPIGPSGPFPSPRRLLFLLVEKV